MLERILIIGCSFLTGVAGVLAARAWDNYVLSRSVDEGLITINED